MEFRKPQVFFIISALAAANSWRDRWLMSTSPDALTKRWPEHNMA
jgi:hypothetical protein